MNISIFAAIGSQNLWDELIVKNEIKALREQYGKYTNFTIYSYDVSNPFIIDPYVKYVEYFPIWIKNPKNIFRNLKNFLTFLINTTSADLIVIWWGGIFFDNEGSSVSSPLNQWLFRTQLFKLFQKRVLFYGVWIHVTQEKNIEIIKKIFSYTKAEVTVRDKASHALLSKIGIDSKIILDPVFNDNNSKNSVLDESFLIKQINPQTFKITDLPSYDYSNKTVGIAFRKGYFQNDILAISEIIEYLKNLWANIILIPNSVHPLDKESDDLYFLNNFAKQHNIEISENITKSYDIYKKRKIDLCFAMRLHGIILAQVYKIPYMAFSYSKKTDEIIKIIKN